MPSSFAGPKGIPFLGHLPAFGRDPLGFLTQTVERYGDLVHLQFEKERETYLISRPDLIQTVLTSTNRTFSKGYDHDPIMHRVLGKGLVTSEGSFWLRQRRLSQPAFHRQRLVDYSTTMVKNTEQLLQTWLAYEDGALIDAHEAMMHLTMNIVAETLFGIDVRQQAPEVSQALETVLHEYTTQLTSAFRQIMSHLSVTLPMPGQHRLEAAVRQLDSYIYAMIADHRNASQTHEDLLSTLIAARDEDGKPMTDQQLRDEVMTLFLAGHETTANTLSWTWYMLALHPEKEQTLCTEAAQQLQGRVPTIDDIVHLPYADQVIKESLRLYPPVWWFSRETLVDWELPEGTIPKGSEVALSPWVMHRHPAFFDNALSWEPERWQHDLEKQLPKQVYFPFGGGPRLCIGAAFAMMETVLLLSTLIQHVRLEIVEQTQADLELSLTLRPKYGLRMRLRKRALSA